MATIVFAGGGTAGHIEPALAVAREWNISHPDDEILFLGTKKGLENTLVPANGFRLLLIPKVAISRKPSVTWLKIPFDLLNSIRASYAILQSADLLIGFGGYVSAPAYLAARLAKVPTLVHEANRQPGWSNRLGALLTPHLAVAHPVQSREFRGALLTGLPLRADVAQACRESSGDWMAARVQAKTALGFDKNTPLIFIMGGSQGSVAINAIVAQSLEGLHLKDISILHSVGRLNSLPQAHPWYKPVSYVQDMALAYLASDLLIARSGAVTCSEFAALGRYALFVPLPVGNGEQAHNAGALIHSGRAEVVAQSDFNSQYLLSSIDSLLSKSRAASSAGDTKDLNAAHKIVALGEFALGAS